MLTTPLDQLEERAAALADRFAHAGIGSRVVPAAGAVGGGAFPAVDIPSAGIALAGDPRDVEPRLRAHTRPVIARVHGGATILNLRSVPERDDDALGAAVVEALA
jgi:L-seryl-tRNA(Ser) seleniumtransferase